MNETTGKCRSTKPNHRELKKHKTNEAEPGRNLDKKKGVKSLAVFFQIRPIIVVN